MVRDVMPNKADDRNLLLLHLQSFRALTPEMTNTQLRPGLWAGMISLLDCYYAGGHRESGDPETNVATAWWITRIFYRHSNQVFQQSVNMLFSGGATSGINAAGFG